MTKLKKIDKNWHIFKHKNKIRTDLKKQDKNWDKKIFYYFKY